MRYQKFKRQGKKLITDGTLQKREEGHNESNLPLVRQRKALPTILEKKQ